MLGCFEYKRQHKENILILMITKCSQRPVQKAISQGDHCKNCIVSDTWSCIVEVSMPDRVLIAIYY